ncbi:hypothetical protein RSOLAG1IB_11994 [Rhizoctonia solani AG-1 IB]|uniref:Uncharacterized protein n=1 Tax=Thanatephorus cucumeris (strain AG1-IB / isolate 7/3/14) TaxID=1108050 RepID=A0A0B7FFC2_THACB|nr:hypothetical protein RSOLAG1IB_11994 [Rhizoctonia solani AG-1 IB]
MIHSHLLLYYFLFDLAQSWRISWRCATNFHSATVSFSLSPTCLCIWVMCCCAVEVELQFIRPNDVIGPSSRSLLLALSPVSVPGPRNHRMHSISLDLAHWCHSLFFSYSRNMLKHAINAPVHILLNLEPNLRAGSLPPSVFRETTLIYAYAILYCTGYLIVSGINVQRSQLEFSQF